MRHIRAAIVAAWIFRLMSVRDAFMIHSAVKAYFRHGLKENGDAAMRKMNIVLIAMVLCSLALPSTTVKAGCVSSWSSRDYKSIGQVQKEILSRYAGARIINVQLCGQGAGASIRIVIDTGRDIKTVTVGAK